MGLSPYKTPDKAYAELWEYSAKDFFKQAIEEKFGEAQTTKSYVRQLIRRDRKLLNYVTWSIRAKHDEFWKRNFNVGEEGNIMKRLKQMFPDPRAVKLVYGQILGHIFTSSGTMGETEALKRVQNVDYWSEQMLSPKYVYDTVTDNKQETNAFGGIITAEVDGWLKKEKETIGIVEHKQRQANPKYDMPTKDKKPAEMVQMNLYMYMTNMDKCLWVQTNKFGNKQTCTTIPRDPVLVKNILQKAVETVQTLNRIYTDVDFRNKLLDASYDPTRNIIWPNPERNTEIDY